jgi:hypothetical protein
LRSLPAAARWDDRAGGSIGRSGPVFIGASRVANGFSDLILELYGKDAGHHARMAVGMATLPLNYCFLVGAEVAVAS